MSSKEKAQVPAPIPAPASQVLTNFTQIGAYMNFELDKDDVIDMIIDERVEALETELAQLKLVEKELNKESLEFREKRAEHIEKTFRKLYAEELKLLAKINPNLADRPPQIYPVGKYEDQKCTRVVLDLQANSQKGKLGNVSFHMSLTHDFRENELEDFSSDSKAYKDLSQKMDEVSHKITDLEKEIHKTSTSNKRAKARLVRSLLKASPQGNDLLSKIPSMNKMLEENK